MRFKFAEHAPRDQRGLDLGAHGAPLALAHLALARGARLHRGRQPGRAGGAGPRLRGARRARRAERATWSRSCSKAAGPPACAWAARRSPADAVVSTVTTSPLPQAGRGTATARTCDGLRAHPHHRDLLPLPAPAPSRVTPFFWVNTQRPARALRGHDRVHEPEPAARAGRRPHPLRPAVPLRRRSALRADRRGGAAAPTRTPSPSSIPAFDRSWVRFSAVFRDRFAQPICLTDYRDDDARPSPRRCRTCSSPTPASSIPHDRTISGSFGLGREAARRALGTRS